MNRKSVLKGLVLLTLLMVVGTEFGLVGPQARPAVGLVQEDGGAVPAAFSIGSVARAVWSPSFDSAGAVARRPVRASATESPGACPTGA
jgi:succinylarginine dihydrolase